jgi:hypothetical protein
MGHAKKRSLEEATTEAAETTADTAVAKAATETETGVSAAAREGAAAVEAARGLLTEDANAAEKRWAGLEDDEVAVEVARYREGIRALEAVLRVSGVDVGTNDEEGGKGAQRNPLFP